MNDRDKKMVFILQGLADGKSRQEIAKELKLTYRTVGNYISNAIHFQGAKDVTHLTAMYFRKNYIK